MITVLHKLCTTKSYTIHKQLLGLYTKCNIKFHSSTYHKLIRGLHYNCGLLESKLPLKFLARNDSTAPFNINTNVQNNVFLYKHENWKYQRNLFIFGIGQLIVFGIFFFLGCEYILETIIEHENWTTKDIAYKHPFGLSVCVISLLLGPGIVILIWNLIKRSIKYIILHKGGEHVTVVTFHPLKKERRFTVPLNMVQSKFSRSHKKYYMPVKIKNQRFHYMLDSDGVFSNPILFDYTVGLYKA